MDWMLFIQVLILMMFAGLVSSFVISVYYTQKDNSWSKRIGALGEAFKTFSKEIAENQVSAKMKVIDEMVESIKSKKE